MSLDRNAGGEMRCRGRPPKHATSEERAEAKKKADAASRARVGLVKVTVDVHREDVGAVRAHARELNRRWREMRDAKS